MTQLRNRFIAFFKMKNVQFQWQLRDSVFICILGLACLSIFYFYRFHRSDDALITARYAYHLGNGEGLVYNLRERFQGFTSPLQALYLGAISLIVQDRESLPLLQNLISVCSLWGIGVLLYRIAAAYHSRVFGVCLALLACTPTMILNTIGFETLTYIFMGFYAIHLFTRQRYKLAYLMLALATLTRFDCVVLFVLLSVYYFTEHRGKPIDRNPFFIYGVTVGLWLVFAWIYFGNPLLFCFRRNWTTADPELV